MTNLELVKLVFPNNLVEQEGNDIVIDNFIRIHPCKVQPVLQDEKDGWAADAILEESDDKDDIIFIDEDFSFNEVVIATAKWYAGYLAETIIENNK